MRDEGLVEWAGDVEIVEEPSDLEASELEEGRADEAAAAGTGRAAARGAEKHDAEKRGGEKTGRRRRRRRRGDRKPGAPTDESARTANGPTVSADEDLDQTESLAPADELGEREPELDASELEIADEELVEPVRPDEGQRRVKRRRRRSRKGLAKPPAGVTGDGAAAELVTQVVADPSHDVVLSADEGEAEDEHAPSEMAEEEGDEGDLKPGHRGIPTWEDAVGMLVAANMEARAKHPRPSSAAPRGRGRSSRGRRRSTGG